MKKHKKILYIQYTNPACYPSLEHSSRILANKGWEILFLGTGAFGSADHLRFQPNRNITVYRLPFCRHGWMQKLHYLWFCTWVIWRALCWQPRWIYASDSLACPIALILSYFPGMKVIYHEHDSPNSPPPFLISWTRSQLAHRAKFCVLPNLERAEKFKNDIDKNIKTLSVWNCPMRDETTFSRKANNGKNNIRLLYHGSIAPPRLPLTLLKAMSEIPERIYLRILGCEPEGHLGYVKMLKEKAKELKIDNRIEFIGAVPTRRQLLEYSRGCDIGLALMPKETQDINEKIMAGASNKPFEYLASGLALLISDLPRWKEMYVVPGYGLACNPDAVESIKEAIRWFLDHPDHMREMAEKGRERVITDWNYENQFAPVLEAMEQLNANQTRIDAN